MKDAPLTWYDWARRTGPLYRLGRWIYRTCKRVFFNVLRKATPDWCPFGPPRGTFSVLGLVREKQILGRILQEALPPPKLPHNSLRALAPLMQDTLGSWTVFWSLHREAHLVGKSLALMDSRKRLAEEAIYAPYSTVAEPSYHALRFPKPIRLAGNWTSVISVCSGGFYHWFGDVLPRLSYLAEYPSDTKVLVPYPLLPYQEETLIWLGLEGKFRPTNEKHLIIENFYFSAPTAMSGAYDPYGVEFVRRSLLSKADPTVKFPKRFFLQRVGRARGIQNEKEVVQFFSQRGWAIINTEELPLAQQISLFANAEAVCGLHGAGLIHLLWCRPGCRVYELVSSTYMNGVYEGISSILGLNYRFLICPGDASFKAYVDVEQLSNFIVD